MVREVRAVGEGKVNRCHTHFILSRGYSFLLLPFSFIPQVLSFFPCIFSSFSRQKEFLVGIFCWWMKREDIPRSSFRSLARSFTSFWLERCQDDYYAREVREIHHFPIHFIPFPFAGHNFSLPLPTFSFGVGIIVQKWSKDDLGNRSIVSVSTLQELVSQAHILFIPFPHSSLFFSSFARKMSLEAAGRSVLLSYLPLIPCGRERKKDGTNETIINLPFSRTTFSYPSRASAKRKDGREK